MAKARNTPTQREIAKKHWERMRTYCEKRGNLSPECIDAFHMALDADNDAEWWIALGWYWINQPFILLFGNIAAVLSLLFAVEILFYPEAKPDINDAPWKNVGFFDGFGFILMEGVATLIKPEYFFLCQVLTWGECDLSETALVYMTNSEASLWFLVEAFFLPWLMPEALFFVSAFWWIYAFQFLLYCMRFWGSLFFDDSGDGSYAEITIDSDYATAE